MNIFYFSNFKYFAGNSVVVRGKIHCKNYLLGTGVRGHQYIDAFMHCLYKLGDTGFNLGCGNNIHLLKCGKLPFVFWIY